MKKLIERTLLKGRIDEIGRLLLTPEQMKELKFAEGETAFLDFGDSYIIIAKELGYSLAYDRVKVMVNGVHIGRDICRSKLFMTEDRKIVENVPQKVYDSDGTYLKNDIMNVVYYNIEFLIDNNRIIIPLTDEQQQAELSILRAVDEFGRIIIPRYLRELHNLVDETGVKVNKNRILISNHITRKTQIDQLGRLLIPKDILEFLKIKPKMELQIETSENIILSKPKK